MKKAFHKFDITTVQYGYNFKNNYHYALLMLRHTQPLHYNIVKQNK